MMRSHWDPGFFFFFIGKQYCNSIYTEVHNKALFHPKNADTFHETICCNIY